MKCFMGLRNAIIIQVVAALLVFGVYQLCWGQTDEIQAQFDHGGEPDLAYFTLYYSSTQGGPYPNALPNILIGAYQPPPAWMILPVQLAAGTYYFVATASDSAVPPNESLYSGEVQVVIQDVAPGEPTILRFKIVYSDGTEEIFEVTPP